MIQAAAMPHNAIQGDLFAGFAVSAVPAKKAKRPAFRRASRPLARTLPAQCVQLLIDLKARQHDAIEEDDDELVRAPIVHAWVSAHDAPPPKTCAPRSIFEMAAAQVIAEAMASADFEPEPQPRAIQEAVHLRITKSAGITRVARMHHTETTEWQEREAARRARQKPPKPPKQSFAMGKRAKMAQGG